MLPRAASGFRISVDLGRFFSDERALCYMYVRGGGEAHGRRVRWLVARLRRRFALRGALCLTLDGRLLPPAEPLALLTADAALQVVPVEKDWFSGHSDTSDDDSSVGSGTDAQDGPKRKRRRPWSAASGEVARIPAPRVQNGPVPEPAPAPNLGYASKVNPALNPGPTSQPGATAGLGPIADPSPAGSTPLADPDPAPKPGPVEDMGLVAAPASLVDPRRAADPAPLADRGPGADCLDSARSPATVDLQSCKQHALAILEQYCVAPASPPQRARRRRARRRPHRARAHTPPPAHAIRARSPSVVRNGAGARCERAARLVRPLPVVCSAGEIHASGCTHAMDRVVMSHSMVAGANGSDTLT